MDSGSGGESLRKTKRRVRVDSGDGCESLRKAKRRATYASMEPDKKADLLKNMRTRKNAGSKLDSSPPTARVSLGLADPDDKRLLRNRSKRMAYASMDPAKKEELLARQRARYRQRLANVASTSSTMGRDCATKTNGLDATDQSIRFSMIRDVHQEPWTLLGTPCCEFFQAIRFHGEPAGFCCSSGQVRLAKTVRCDALWSLFMDTTSDLSKEFRRRSRSYNNAFAYTSLGMYFDKDCWWARDGVYSLKVNGQVTHFFKPVSDQPNTDQMMQLFFIDTAAYLSDDMLAQKQFNNEIVDIIASVLASNLYSKVFKRLRSWDDLQDVNIVIRGDSSLDQRTHNLPTVDQVAGVWKDGEGGVQGSVRDIRVHTIGGRNQNIPYYCGAYDSLWSLRKSP